MGLKSSFIALMDKPYLLFQIAFFLSLNRKEKKKLIKKLEKERKRNRKEEKRERKRRMQAVKEKESRSAREAEIHKNAEKSDISSDEGELTSTICVNVTSQLCQVMFHVLSIFFLVKLAAYCPGYETT